MTFGNFCKNGNPVLLWDMKEYRFGKIKYLDFLGQSNYELFQVDAAIAYDSVNVAVSAINNLLKQNSGLFNKTFKHDNVWNRDYPGVYCHPSQDKLHPNRPFSPLEHGPLLAKHLREVQYTSFQFLFKSFCPIFDRVCKGSCQRFNWPH